MGELVVTALRFGFLILLWIMIISIVSALRRDLQIGKRSRTGTPTAREVRKNPDPAEAAPAPRAAPRRLVVTEGPLSGHSLELAASPILLGRAQEATLVLEDDYASRPPCPPLPAGQPLVHRGFGLHQRHLSGREPTDPCPAR